MFIHLKGERKLPSESISLPTEIDLSKEGGAGEYYKLRDDLLAEDIHVLLVNKITLSDGRQARGLSGVGMAWMVLKADRFKTLPKIILHELGHNCGIGPHTDIDYNVMRELEEDHEIYDTLNPGYFDGADIHRIQHLGSQRDRFLNHNPHPVLEAE